MRIAITITALLVAISACCTGSQRPFCTRAPADASDCAHATAALPDDCRQGLADACSRLAATGYLAPPLQCMASAGDCAAARACKPTAIPGGIPR